MLWSWLVVCVVVVSQVLWSANCFMTVAKTMVSMTVVAMDCRKFSIPNTHLHSWHCLGHVSVHWASVSTLFSFCKAKQNEILKQYNLFAAQCVPIYLCQSLFPCLLFHILFVLLGCTSSWTSRPAICGEGIVFGGCTIIWFGLCFVSWVFFGIVRSFAKKDDAVQDL